MAITRTPIIDDSGSGTDGTVIDNAWKQELYNQIDAAGGAIQTYVVNWGCASGAQPVLGNGALTGHYAAMGGVVWVNIRLQIGSTTTLGTGGWIFRLPFLNAGWGINATGLAIIGVAYTLVGAYPHTVEWINPFSGPSGSAAVSMDATHPAAWTAGSHMDYYVTYRRA